MLSVDLNVTVYHVSFEAKTFTISASHKSSQKIFHRLQNLDHGPLKAVFVCTETPENGELLHCSHEPDNSDDRYSSCMTRPLLGNRFSIFRVKKFHRSLKNCETFCLKTFMVYSI